MVLMNVLYNRCYGGFGLSEEALVLYNKYCTEAGIPIVEDDSSIKRHDPILFRVFGELGNKVNGGCSRIKSVEINAEYEKFYRIMDYDGMESVVIDIDRYKVYKITEILDSDLSDSQKFEEIRKIIALQINLRFKL
jgi:hypothetical protein